MTMEYKGKGKKQIHQQRSTKQHSINNWGEISRNFLKVEEVEINQRFTNLSISGHHNEAASLENLTKDEEPDKPNTGAFSKRGSMGFETGTDLIRGALLCSAGTIGSHLRTGGERRRAKSSCCSRTGMDQDTLSKAGDLTLCFKFGHMATRQ